MLYGQKTEALIKEEYDLERAISALEEAAQFADTDDVNGLAGNICKKALKELK